jgi:hypothetical protein
MPSTYTTRNGIELIATGEQSGSWGDTTNVNLQIIDRALSGVGTIDLSGSGASHTLSTTDGTLSDGMYKVLDLSGATQACVITISPNTASKLYFVDNNSGFQCTISQGSGATVAIPDGESRIVYADGAGAGAAVVDFTGLIKLANTQITGLGTMSTQNATSVNIDGGAIDDTPVGSTTANTGSFTNLTGSGTVNLNGLIYPTSDGTSGQVIQTDGAGTLTFAAGGGGGGDAGLQDIMLLMGA